MGLHLVTGYAGKAHIASADQGAFNAGVFGEGEYVMNTGKQLSAQVISNNQIRIFDGDIIMQGRHINLKKDTFEDVAIANGLQGLNRNDLIVIRYTKDANTGVESIALAVLQGVSTEGTASDPSYTEGDILSGECLLHEMPLYRVPLTGLNVGTPKKLFSTMGGFDTHTHDKRYYQKAEVDGKITTINNNLGGLRFGVDGDGNYGYYGADDSLIPFKSGVKAFFDGWGDQYHVFYNPDKLITINITNTTKTITFKKSGVYTIVLKYAVATSGNLLIRSIINGESKDIVSKSVASGTTKEEVFKVTVSTNSTVTIYTQQANNSDCMVVAIS